AILGLLSHFLPNYSTMKFLNFLYDRSFLGEYKADLKYKAYINTEKQLYEGVNKIKFNLQINDEGSFIKTQETIVNSDSISQSESYIISSSKDKIIIYFKYFQRANYKDNSDRVQDGHEILEFDKRKKEITKLIYFTNKPSSGETINIKKLNKKN
ncbi:MAG: hypothetical protein ACRCXE_01675, partial [Metamycoplasmataceae bacterium]